MKPIRSLRSILPGSLVALFLGGCTAEAVGPEAVGHTEQASICLDCGGEGTPGGGGGGGEHCHDLPGAQPTATATYSCNATVHDVLGRGVPNLPVELTSTWYPSDVSGTAVVIKKVTGTTDARGQVHLDLTSRVANNVSCQIDPTGVAKSVVESNEQGANTCGATVPSGTVLTATQKDWARFDERFPASTAMRSETSFDDATELRQVENGISVRTPVGYLYQSGAYDKVLVIAEPFDADENTSNNRGRIGMQRDFRQLLEKLGPLGWDIWIVQPSSTGDSVHRQAADLARAIQHAATRGGTSCGSKVTVFGFSLGGQVARVALARWETDAAFRAENGLAATPPVNLFVSGDSPQDGANVNPELQGLIWKNKGGDAVHDANLDSCAAAQMLRIHQRQPIRMIPEPGVNRTFMVDPTTLPNDTGFRTFQLTDQPVTVYTRGVTPVTCTPGPAVANLFPHSMRTVAFSNGTLNTSNRCSTIASGLDRADGYDLCEQAPSRPYVPGVGSTLFRIYKELGPGPLDWIPTDDYVNATRDDIAPGSRHDRLFSKDTYQAGFIGEGWMEQRFAHTFMPTTSVFGMDRPLGDNKFQSQATPFDRTFENDHNGFHSAYYPALVDRVVSEELEPAGNACLSVIFMPPGWQTR